jgi:FK506-binding nuclear protein
MSVQGFWGLACHPEKTYSQVVSAPFRLTMVSFKYIHQKKCQSNLAKQASLTEEVKDNKRSCVTVNVDNKEYTLCTLIANKVTS